MATYNVVTDLGADDTGSTAIDSDIEPEVASGNTLVFPAGEYLLNSLNVGSSVSNFTLDGHPDAVLIPKDWGSSTPTNPFISVAGSGFKWDQFDVRVNGRNPGAVDIAADNWEISRIVTRGEVHCETDGNTGSSSEARTWFSLWVNSSGATGLLEDCYFHNGSNQSVNAGSNRRAILIDGGLGDITINRCWFEQWGENTIYAKHPVGKLRILNSYWRNSQNGARTGGNTEIRNCISIKDGPNPKNWANSALQRGVAYEAEGTTTGDRNQYNGLHEIRECDFVHDYRSPSGEPDSCGAPIGGSAAPEYAEIHDARIYYNSDRSHDAIYNGQGAHGAPKRWGIDRVQLENNCNGDQYCVQVNATPNNWGAVTGTWSASNNQYSNSAHVRSRFDNGNPTGPDTTPPLPEPPGAPSAMGNATVVTIDNTGTNQGTEYSFKGSATGNTVDAGTIHPSGVGGASINMDWAGKYPRRESAASGELSPGGIHRYYIADGALLDGSFTQSGNATLTVDGTTVSQTPPTNRWDASAGSWVDIPDGAVYGDAALDLSQMKYYDGSAGEWKLAVDRS